MSDGRMAPHERLHLGRWIRVTYKIPFIVHGRRRTPTMRSTRMGTPVLALPLKAYFNHDGLSTSWSLTPHVFLPLETTDLGHSTSLAGLSARYAHETYRDAVDLGSVVRADVEGGDLGGTSPRATGARSTSARPSGSVGCGSTARCAAAGATSPRAWRRRLLEVHRFGACTGDGDAHRDE